MGFFQFTTAERMLGKAKRELTRLEVDDSVDHVFNFFVTANHIVDYLDGRLAKSDVEAIKADSLITDCRDACNKAKHMKLERKRADVKTPTTYHVTLREGCPPGAADEHVERRIVWPDGKSVEVISFARDVIGKWEEIFRKHGIGA